MERSPYGNPVVRIAQEQPSLGRTFVACRTVRRASAVAQKAPCHCNVAPCRCVSVRFVRYGTDPRDVRFVVNKFGAVHRSESKRPKSEVRLVMWHGISYDRTLPMSIR